MSYSEIQNKVIDQLDQSANIIGIEDFEAQRDGNSPEETVVEITTFDGDEYYFRYNIWPDGETELHRFKLEKSSLIQYDERFSMFREKNKITLEENKMKEIKEEKKMDYTDRIYDRYLERVRQYVSDNADELREYKAELLEGKVDDMTDDEIECDVKAVIDSNVEYESVSDLINIDNCDIEDILNDYDIL